MKPLFEQFDFGYALKCPVCGQSFLHHKKIEIFDREEDQKKGLHIKVENGVTETNTDLEGNPSRRRHGLTIQFWCEICEKKVEMSIAQHKGNTFIDFK